MLLAELSYSGGENVGVNTTERRENLEMGGISHVRDFQVVCEVAPILPIVSEEEASGCRLPHRTHML